MLCSTLSGSRVLPRSILVSTNRYVSYDTRSNPITIATKFLSLGSIKRASGDTIPWCDGNLYFYFPSPYFCHFYILFLTQLYSFTSSTI